MHPCTCFHLASQSVSFGWCIWFYYHFLNCFGLIFCRSFLLLCLLPREVPLAFVVKLVWWCWILFTFACLESFLFLHRIWMGILGCRFFSILTLNMSCPSLLTCRVSLRNQLIAWWEFLCMLFVAFPLLLLIFYLCIWFL